MMTPVEPTFVHPTAILDADVQLGPGTKIWHFSHVLSGARLGAQCHIGQNVVIGRNVMIGDRCRIQNNVTVYEEVTLEEEVFCGPSMVFTNVINPRAHISRKHELRPTLVKRGCSIGANATIVCGSVLGRYSLIGAGSVVTKDIPDHALMIGNPARRTGWVCQCGNKLRLIPSVKPSGDATNSNPDLYTCPVCVMTYHSVAGCGLEAITQAR
ncbi:MAG: N-acetyltransferase [Magnetococcales bacterium]|nr:N-acetyltransferase [Magnetococcales bacterium]MBF0149589.1 N-acetyltransferase [Magnetococcales bacterium]MBF0174638.1 N-acetyltransferase [Magnetococcales bacterium]MBF0348234.1 N-acetyltransferase [Magnetococcales bacterium]